MTALPQHTMTVEEFLAWSAAQPKEAGRFELWDGLIIEKRGAAGEMNAERSQHWRMKAALYRAAYAALKVSGLEGDVVIDGAGVRLPSNRLVEPDVLVYLGPKVGRDALIVPDPIIVCEVLSPSTAKLDLSLKLDGYFALASIQHYVIADPDKPMGTHVFTAVDYKNEGNDLKWMEVSITRRSGSDIQTSALPGRKLRQEASAEPLPTGAEVSGGHLRFTPTADQTGRHAIAIQASLGPLRALERIDVVVTGVNRAPTLGNPGPQQVLEGAELVVPLVASDPDGDVVSLVPLSSLPANALLDSVGSRLVFRPAYDQAGSIPIEIGANDGKATTSVAFTIEVQDRAPSAGPPELVIDRVPSPTLQTRTTISGNVVGAAGVALDPEPFVAISGLSPSTGRQGRELDVTLTGLNTAFVQDQTAADFGPGIVVESLTVSSPTSAVARIAIDPGAALGTRVVSLSGAGPAAAGPGSACPHRAECPRSGPGWRSSSHW